MKNIKIDNLGIPPLAGICSYEDTLKEGYPVETNVTLLKRYCYASSKLNETMAAHLPSMPFWEVKCALSLHMWLVAEHSEMTRKRVSEMREPPHHFEKVPDERLGLFFEELIRSSNTMELLIGIYKIVLPEFIRSVVKHLAETHPIADQPTCRMLRIIKQEMEEMVAWGKDAVYAVSQLMQGQYNPADFTQHLSHYLVQSGGIFGDLVDSDCPSLLPSRFNGEPYHMDVMPVRDERFTDVFNRSGDIESYYKDTTLPYDERTFALFYKRLKEMDVPEWMARIIYETKGEPWGYYLDLSRQLWDECRHAMMGEIGLYSRGVPFYKYPIELTGSVSLNTKFTALEAHLILWSIELYLMRKDVGKKWEVDIAKASENPIAMLFQDYDWADEVLHAQIGRRWLLKRFENMEKLREAANNTDMWKKFEEVRSELGGLSEQKPWWPQFVADMRSI